MGNEKGVTQRQKFIDAVREFEADDDADAFEAAAAKIARAPRLTDEQVKEIAERERKSRKGDK